MTSELLVTNKEILLQIVVKAINDFAGLDRIVPILLVFSAYPRLTKDSPLSPSITERTKAIYKAIKEVRRIHAKQYIRDTLAIRNGLNTYRIHELSL